MPELTERQEAFVAKLVTTRCTQTEAASAAGYEHPTVEASRLIRKPHIAAAIQELRTKVISGDLANVATATLREVMLDRTAPASARVSAARTVWEAAGHLGVRGKDAALSDKPIGEMTAAELEALAGKLEASIAASAREAAAAGNGGPRLATAH